MARPYPLCVLEFAPDFDGRSFSSTRSTRVKSLNCLNPECRSHGKVGSGNVVRHGFYRTGAGKRRRYRCVECEKTFSSTKGTPYYRLQHRRASFDAVVALRVEGVSISAVARVEGLAWNTLSLDGLRKPPTFAVASTRDGLPESGPGSSRPTKFAPSPAGRRGQRGYSSRSRFGRGSGHRQ
ncbi:MAG: hypothetical protein BMS9Abin37_1160 [Acidobacteriota bacterium]|nr:MAG: hypothetical protein BMS9Abin37_1160 [Acidobacteriota bacterium]